MSAFARLARFFPLKSKVPLISFINSKSTSGSLSAFKSILYPTILATTFISKQNEQLVENVLMGSHEIEEEVIDKVFLNPEPELLELMDILEKCIIESCVQYRLCIRKQIELIEKSTIDGNLSNYLDELPEYRNLAFDINHELNNYVVLLKTVGEITYQYLINSAKGDSIKDINLISEKYKNLEMLLQKQLDENRKFEMDLNYANRSMIVNTKTDY